ncbi:MAG TPA: rhodanese-like domain-containing protein, partial [Actinomycetota bacterium]|nr:rhodanese-like domain-containing protein [Actinomycetota bacterium]
DYVSGAAELRAATGARVAGPADAGYRFPFTPLEEGSEVRIGEHRLIAMRTPGHTPEHLSYVLVGPGSDRPAAVFTGGSLIVGSAGRTDLLGPEHTGRLTRAQYRSLRRLLELPDPTPVLPTHGAGSFCASSDPLDERSSTIGRERASNPALAPIDEDAFVREQLSGLSAYPSYYAHMATINRAGPRVLGRVPVPPPLGPAEAADRLATGARLVDARPGAEFAERHAPGSLNVPLDESFASYVGWIVPFSTPIVLLLPGAAGALEEVATQLFRIGYDRLEGYVEGGIDAWQSAGLEIGSYPVATLDEAVGLARSEPERLLDVRQRTEWQAGHVRGSLHAFVADVPGQLAELPADRELVVACATGFRASIAASLLRAAGRRVRVLARGGVPSVLRRLG